MIPHPALGPHMAQKVGISFSPRVLLRASTAFDKGDSPWAFSPKAKEIS
jgi:hypothetical protein